MTYIRYKETRVVVGVRAGEAEQLILGGDPIAVPVDFYLLTRGIELGLAFRHGKVEGDDFVPDEVLSWSEIIRKGSVKNGPSHYAWT